MQQIVLTGRIGKDAELRTTQGGQTVCSFTVASDQGFGDKKQTNWFRASLWGKRGQSLHPYLLKGGQVTVAGELEVTEWEGKTQLNISANDVALQGGRASGQRDDTHPNQDGFGGQSSQNDELDDDFDEIPFLTCDFAFEHKRRLVL